MTPITTGQIEPWITPTDLEQPLPAERRVDAVTALITAGLETRIIVDSTTVEAVGRLIVYKLNELTREPGAGADVSSKAVESFWDELPGQLGDPKYIAKLVGDIRNARTSGADKHGGLLRTLNGDSDKNLIREKEKERLDELREKAARTRTLDFADLKITDELTLKSTSGFTSKSAPSVSAKIKGIVFAIEETDQGPAILLQLSEKEHPADEHNKPRKKGEIVRIIGTKSFESSSANHTPTKLVQGEALQYANGEVGSWNGGVRHRFPELDQIEINKTKIFPERRWVRADHTLDRTLKERRVFL